MENHVMNTQMCSVTIFKFGFDYRHYISTRNGAIGWWKIIYHLTVNIYHFFLQPSTNVGSLFKDKMVQFRITCTGSPEVIQQIFISGEDQVFMECPDIELMKALVDLISLYYVFHVTYPDSMIGILSFLQDIALGCTDIAYKGTKYSSFMAELRNIMCWHSSIQIRALVFKY